MIRFVVLASVAVACFFGLSTEVFGQEWPSYQNVPTPDPHLIDRGPGAYFAIWKLVLLVLFFLVWVKLADFVNRDVQVVAEQTKMPPEIWNPVMVFSFFIGFLIAITLPFFFLGLPLYILASIGPFVGYAIMRNQRSASDDKLFSKERRVRMREERQAETTGVPVIRALPQDQGAPVTFKASGADATKAQANLITARQNPFFAAFKDIVYESLMLRSDMLMFDYTREQVNIRRQIDGFWHSLPVMDRQTGDTLLFAIKRLGDLNPEERTQRQSGTFSVEIPDQKFTVELTSQGVKTGERVLLKFVGKKKQSMKLGELGMLPSLQKRLQESLNTSGLVIVSATPGDGYTTTWNAVLNLSDRLTRDFHGVADQSHKDTYAENIEFHYSDPTLDLTPEKVLRTLSLKMPEAYVVPDMFNKSMFETLCREVVDNNRFVITRVPAKGVAEAIVRELQYKQDRSLFAKALTAVIYQRLCRRLCDYCKQPYEPSPQLLQKLRLRPDQVKQLYREYQPPPPEELVDAKGRPIPAPVCNVCSGLGYLGRISMYDFLEVDENVRRAIVNEPSVEGISAAIRKSGNLGLQAAGLQLVVKGVTSLTELQRVLKG